ncbi:MAG: PorV/PorQ family protein [bacterium]
MVTKKSQTTIFVLMVCLWSGIALGQEDIGSGLLKIGIGARPAGLGGAFTALSDDINALHWNPAGLGKLREKELAFTHAVFYGDIREEFVGYAHPLGRLGAVGGGLTYLHLDEVRQRDESGDEIASFTPYDLLGILAWAGKIGRNFEIGANFKYIYQKNREAEITKANYLDVGGIASFRPLKFGLVLQNLSYDRPKEDPLPRTVRSGLALNLFNETAIFVLDAVKEKDEDIQYGLGAEYRPGSPLALRLGAKFDEDEEAKVTAGLGLTWKICRLDYAFLRHDRNSDNIHRLSLSLRF